MIEDTLQSDWVRKPVWVKYECDKDNRWTALKGGIVQEADNVPCNFIGCGDKCIAHIRGETDKRIEAYDWFRNVSEEQE